MAQAPRKYINTSDREVEIALARYGFPLGNLDGSEGSDYSCPEELIIDILKHAPRPRSLYGGIPVLLVKNRIDYKKLSDLAIEEGVPQQLGLMLAYSKISFDQKRITAYDKVGLDLAIERLEKHIPEEPVSLNPDMKGLLYKKSAEERLKELSLEKWRVIAKPDLEGTLDYLEQNDAA